MTLSPDQDRTHESIINGELARFLRDRVRTGRCSRDAFDTDLVSNRTKPLLPV